MNKNKIHILLVDDDRQNSLLLKRFLELEGYSVTYASDGAAAWEMYNRQHPDLILLDVNMPVMNGFELAQKIREMDNEVFLFFLTDRTEKADRLKGFHLKGNDYIPKPFYPEELIARIDERFENRKVNVQCRYMIGKTLFDSQNSTVTYNGITRNLSARQTDILVLLSRSAGILVTRDEILNQVWGDISYWWVLSIPFFISCIRQQNPLTVLSKIILRKVKQFNLPPQKNEGFLHF